ncbi:MAG: hypothetical protein ABJA67_02595, partial [Chthonomonadales bacterium]
SPVIKLTTTASSKWEMQIAADPTGTDIVWESNKLDGGSSVKPQSTNGKFAGSHLGRNTFKMGTYWIRVREPNSAGVWQPWTEWHSPFHVVS